MSLKCLAPNTKQIIAASHKPLCFSPVSKVLILILKENTMVLSEEIQGIRWGGGYFGWRLANGYTSQKNRYDITKWATSDQLILRQVFT